MYGLGILTGLQVVFKHFVDSYLDDVRWLGRRIVQDHFQDEESLLRQDDNRVATSQEF